MKCLPLTSIDRKFLLPLFLSFSKLYSSLILNVVLFLLSTHSTSQSVHCANWFLCISCRFPFPTFLSFIPHTLIGALIITTSLRSPSRPDLFMRGWYCRPLVRHHYSSQAISEIPLALDIEPSSCIDVDYLCDTINFLQTWWNNKQTYWKIHTLHTILSMSHAYTKKKVSNKITHTCRRFYK